MTIDRARFQTLFQAPPAQRQTCVIRAVDVKKIYRMGSIETHALRGATLDVYQGEYLSIMARAARASPPCST